MIEPRTDEQAVRQTRKTQRKPRGFRLPGVSYSAYVQIRDDSRNDGRRMAYRNGVLWIMSPQFRHDKGSSWINLIVWAYVDATDLDCTPSASTTFRRKLDGEEEGVGKEADESYYLGKLAAEVRTKDELNLPDDPPPSLWVEVDNSGDSTVKLPLYAALRVPEVWQYRVRRKALKFWRLENGAYTEIPVSQALPGLTPAMVLELLDEARARTAPDWMRWMRTDWFARNRALFPDFRDRQP